MGIAISRVMKFQSADKFATGFIKGGDFHGIMSVKVLDQSKRSDIEARYVIRHSLACSLSLPLPSIRAQIIELKTLESSS